jgi:hypothetical protein
LIWSARVRCLSESNPKRASMRLSLRIGRLRVCHRRYIELFQDDPNMDDLPGLAPDDVSVSL